MGNSYEHDDSASRATKRMVANITENFNSKTNELRQRVAQLNKLQAQESLRMSGDISRLNKVLEDCKAENHALLARRQAIQSMKEQDATELSRLDTENTGLQAQVRDLSAANLKLKDRKAECDQRLQGLQSRLQAVRTKHDAKISKQKLVNEKYKKYLGIDVYRLKDHVLKIEFMNLEVDSYIIVDFNSDLHITECVPELSLEKLNFMFNEGGDFYEFIKFVRKEFQHKN